mmetsp:Transcript_111653/g.320768  ORF Transcript_111653/g.320768 Transcript_111653/m.320768 type:complete len:221 (+) Transcript_111653:672-1334(+)
MSRTFSCSKPLSIDFWKCDRMSGTPFTLDMSALDPSGSKNSPEPSPTPVSCFMKDSNDAFMAFTCSFAQSSHSNLYFLSKCTRKSDFFVNDFPSRVQTQFFPCFFECSSMNWSNLSSSSFQGNTPFIISSTTPPSSIISPTHMFMKWSMSKSSRSRSPDLSYFRRFLSSDSTENASAILWNFGLASGSSGFLSGWYLRERFLYAFLISSAVAPRRTPRIL